MGVAGAVRGQQPLHDGFRVGLDGEDVHREGPREELRGEALEHPCGARGKGGVTEVRGPGVGEKVPHSDRPSNHRNP